jgi:ribosomal protein S18 acetylase RimI-like enzyme
MRVRYLKPGDRRRIEEMVVSSEKFTDVEVTTALELVDEAVVKGEASGYIFALLEDEEEGSAIKGYACYGPTPLTQGVYDLYWIVVDPSFQRRGLGQLLLCHAEQDILKRGGRMILIETSSQESYRSTVFFYEQNGYGLAGRIKDFYRIGDDKLIFSKDLR